MDNGITLTENGRWSNDEFIYIFMYIYIDYFLFFTRVYIYVCDLTFTTDWLTCVEEYGGGGGGRRWMRRSKVLNRCSQCTSCARELNGLCNNNNNNNKMWQRFTKLLFYFVFIFSVHNINPNHFLYSTLIICTVLYFFAIVCIILL